MQLLDQIRQQIPQPVIDGWITTAQFAGHIHWWWVFDGIVAAWVIFWIVQGYLLSHRSGYFAPQLSCAPALVRYAVATLAGWYFIGPIIIRGQEHLKVVDGDILIGPNHQIEADAIGVGVGLKRRFVRFLIAINQTAGIRAPFFAWFGAISVGYSKDNKAGAAAEAAVEALVAEAKRRWNRMVVFLMFPQGALYRTDQWDRKQFFKGLCRIAREANAQTGRNYWLVPVVAVYDYDPTHAIWFHRFLEQRLGLKRKFLGHRIYRLTIYIGKPLLRSSLPDDDDLAMDKFYEQLVHTRLGARRLSKAAKIVKMTASVAPAN